MNREKIIETLKKNDCTVLSFPERGPWGDSKYRGNCSGFIQAFLMWKYGIKKFGELFAGSGTGSDVAKDMGVDYIGLDLNRTPVRPDILSGNLVTDEIPEAFFDADMIFMHPPYGKEINIPYAGKQYPDPTGTLKQYDLGQMEWKTFIDVLNSIIMKAYCSLKNGAYISYLIGDVRRSGKFYSMLTDVVKVGELQQIIIKMQHNCNSYGRTYSNSNFVPLVHEYLVVMKKVVTTYYDICFSVEQKYNMDIRDSKKATWCDVVRAVLQKLNGKASLQEIYNEVAYHKKTNTNPHWQEKIRQTLQRYSIFASDQRGTWYLTKGGASYV